MTFRPKLWMTVAAIPALMMLIYLGTWQVMRMQWKDALIEEFTSRATAAAVAPPAAASAADNQYQRMKLTGVWMHHAETQLIGRTFEGTAGYHVITPFRLDDGRVMLLNRGWVSQDYRLPEARPSTLTAGPVEVTAILRLPARKGYFVPANNPQQNDWFTLNIADIAAHHQLGDNLITTYTGDVLRNSGPYVLPIGADVDINIPNDHWHYALTWYGLALGLIGVYLAFHYQAGRLRFGGKGGQS
ncbi:MAG: SURF1 family protein [Alphaproteobacteria bacterium]|nr:SURF1 family protein [Alphaproteobacteria bacterium]